MRIAVCIKQVPDTSELRIDPATNTLIRAGVAAVLNPLDEFAVEAALRLRDTLGGEVVAFSMGPPSAEASLRQTIAMGVDSGCLVVDRRFAGADTWATSLTLARALEVAGPFDLVLCGKQAIDGDTAQVGPGIAAHLGWPQVTYVTRLGPAAGPGCLSVDRLLDGLTAVLEVRLPAVLTVLKEANQPRLPSLASRLRSLRAEIRHLDAQALGLEADEVGLKGSPTRVVRISTPSLTRRHRRLDVPVEQQAGDLLAELQARLG